jgi:hypothetical protein
MNRVRKETLTNEIEDTEMMKYEDQIELASSVKVVLSPDTDEWVHSLNIGNVMHLNPISSDELCLNIDNSHEISKDAIVEKVR